MEIESTSDYKGDIDVMFYLEGGKENAKSKEAINKIQRGRNSFRWEILREISEGDYLLQAEISNMELNLRIKEEKKFSVKE